MTMTHEIMNVNGFFTSPPKPKRSRVSSAHTPTALSPQGESRYKAQIAFLRA
jgi:hypothetical protein